MKYEELVRELLQHPNEREWFEFKHNWFEIDALGEYISAISNSCALHGKKEGFFIWGVDNETHKPIGTNINYYGDYKGEPLQNYLLRNLFPRIKVSFHECFIDDNRVVVLVIPCACDIPTSFKEKRYIRIGSSKNNIAHYPAFEKALFMALVKEEKTLTNTKSLYQDLTFNKLFGFYAYKGVLLQQETFKKNLGLFTEDGEYNLLAQLLSDDSHFPLRVSIFLGETKASPLFAVREFGYTCLLFALDDILRYSDVLNIRQADEEGRVLERKEVLLFDNDAYREAIINAFLHNQWTSGNEPMISVFSNRIEILSRGPLPTLQTMEGFFSGVSVPVNPKLSEIFLQLHISEKSGRGVPTIVSKYGKEAFSFSENSIVVTIPFNWINKLSREVKDENKPSSNSLSAKRKEMIDFIKRDPKITKQKLAERIGISTTAVDKNISYLKDHGYLKRIGSNKTGYWQALN